MAKGVLAILGSGEIAPGMTKVHRQILARLDPLRAVNLDTAYGFQENVPQMSQKLEEYFATSLLAKLTTLHFTSYAQASELERTLFKQQVRQANYVFAGPGSPSYALAQWTPLHLEDDLLSVLEVGGTLCFSSAAAFTLGAFTAPVYEIYKVGEEPHWLNGLNVCADLGLSCVVVPHFDNNEGENYDTRYCYLGERRLLHLESQLPEGVAILGVDEHTALILDLEADTLQVLGRAHGYWRQSGETRVFANATTTNLSDLRSLKPSSPKAPPDPRIQPTSRPLELAQIAARGGEGGLEALAQLVQLATTGGEGYIDPTPLVEAILAARVNARLSAQYQLADQLRDVLLESNFDVRDGPEGTTWSRRTSS
jgi:cyanophycinase-like exopeptidase